MKKSDILDLTKYILSFMIVAIHLELWPNILYPWLRLAVPLFFMISSYILFSKLNVTNEETKKVYIKNYIKRNLQLYLFWFIALLPITASVRQNWFSNGVIGLIKYIPNVLFSSTFVASWFIVGAVWAVVILYLTRKINWKILLMIFSLVYLICCIRSSYGYLLSSKVWSVINSYESIFTNPVFSFPVATFWMFIGKLFADLRVRNFKKSLLLIFLVLSSACLWLEWRFVIHLGGLNNNDCYLMLPPVCVCIFALIKDMKIELNNSKTLRTISTVTYPLHSSLIVVVGVIFSRFCGGIDFIWLKYIVVVVGCHIATLIILKIEKFKFFRFFKYAH